MLLRVEKITESSKGGSIVTLKESKTSKKVETVLGVQQQSEFGETYYTKVWEHNLEPGQEIPLNLDNYRIVERPLTTEAGKDIALKWLFLK